MRQNKERKKGKENNSKYFYYFMLFCFLTILLLAKNNTSISAHTSQSIPNDPLYAEQWNLQSSQNATTTNWERFYQIIEQTDIQPLKQTIRIAIIDSGLNINHPDIVANVEVNENEPINGKDDNYDGYIDNRWGCAFTPEDDSCEDAATDTSLTQHGTGTTGVLAAVTDNFIGMSGASHGFDVKVVPLKVIQTGGTANYSDIHEALQYVQNDGNFDVVLINIAGWPNPTSVANMNELITTITNQGAIVVAGSGNSAATEENVLINEGYTFIDSAANIQTVNSETTVGWPARHENVIAVGGTNQDGNRRPSANYGPELDLVAPAEWIRTLCYTDSYCFQSGTSFSGPQVAAAAAFIKAYLPDATFEEVQAILQETAKGENNLELGHGMLDFETIAIKILLKRRVFLPVILN